MFNFLPKELEDIIITHKVQMETHEKFKKCLSEIKNMYHTIVGKKESHRILNGNLVVFKHYKDWGFLSVSSTNYLSIIKIYEKYDDELIFTDQYTEKLSKYYDDNINEFVFDEDELDRYENDDYYMRYATGFYVKRRNVYINFF